MNDARTAALMIVANFSLRDLDEVERELLVRQESLSNADHHDSPEFWNIAAALDLIAYQRDELNSLLGQKWQRVAG
jgi:hypothetical protein